MTERTTAAKGHMPFPGHRTVAEWLPGYAPRIVPVSNYQPCEPRNQRLQPKPPRVSAYGYETPGG